jgi:hypothetical protein
MIESSFTPLHILQGTMDKTRFLKVMRDAGFVRECGGFTSAHAHQVFSRSLPAVEVTLNFIQFLHACRLVASHLRVSLNEVLEDIVLVNTPQACSG